jgi:hypothetical protein
VVSNPNDPAVAGVKAVGDGEPASVVSIPNDPGKAGGYEDVTTHPQKPGVVDSSTQVSRVFLTASALPVTLFADDDFLIFAS